MVVRLEANAEIPKWLSGDFVSITRTIDELSIVCEQKDIAGLKIEKDWRVLKILGPLDFSEIGILANIAEILAKEKISIFVISSYDTDYILVKEVSLAKAIKALEKAGHIVEVN